MDELAAFILARVAEDHDLAYQALMTQEPAASSEPTPGIATRPTPAGPST
ncbi:hypothetical protein IWX75_003109 [Arthrobacter sp. CAN_A6]